MFPPGREFRVRSGCLRSRDEVDQLLDAGQKGWFEVGVGADPAEDPLPGQPDVGRRLVGPAQGRTDTALPVLAAGDHGPRVETEPGRVDRLPDVDVRMPQ